MNEEKHSKIGASSYYRWKKCPGSVRLSEGIVVAQSEYAAEGTKAHELAATILESFFNDPFKKVTVPKNLSSDFLASVNIYVDYIRELWRVTGADYKSGEILIEHKFSLESIHPGLFGTADCVIFCKKQKTLYVIDYKHGAGIPVEVEDNLQLKYYGLGALITSNFKANKVTLVVVQPRCHHEDGDIRTHTFSATELLDFASELEDDARKTEEENAPIIPGDHCRFCPAAPVKCEVLKNQAFLQAQKVFSVNEPDLDKLGQALNILPALKSYIKTVEDYAYNEALMGRVASGYKLVQKKARRKWAAKEEEVVSLVSKLTRLPTSKFYNVELKSPFQMEKLMDVKGSREIRKLMGYEPAGYALVPESDKRPAIGLNTITPFGIIGEKGDLNEKENEETKK